MLLEPNSCTFSVTQPIPPRADSVCSESDLSRWTNSPTQEKPLEHLLQLEAEVLAENSFHCFCESTEIPKHSVHVGKLMDIHGAKHHHMHTHVPAKPCAESWCRMCICLNQT